MNLFTFSAEEASAEAPCICQTPCEGSISHVKKEEYTLLEPHCSNDHASEESKAMIPEDGNNPLMYNIKTESGLHPFETQPHHTHDYIVMGGQKELKPHCYNDHASEESKVMIPEDGNASLMYEIKTESELHPFETLPHHSHDYSVMGDQKEPHCYNDHASEESKVMIPEDGNPSLMCNIKTESECHPFETQPHHTHDYSELYAYNHGENYKEEPDIKDECEDTTSILVVTGHQNVISPSQTDLGRGEVVGSSQIGDPEYEVGTGTSQTDYPSSDNDRPTSETDDVICLDVADDLDPSDEDDSINNSEKLRVSRPTLL